jgi:putative peptidoglycan lipid II flippase
VNLLKAAASVSAMTLLSRITGFVRDYAGGGPFGAGAVTDAFFVAFRIPNLLRRLSPRAPSRRPSCRCWASTAAKQGDEATRGSPDRVLGMLRFWLVVITVDRDGGRPALVYVIGSGFARDADKFDLTVTMLRICFPYILFVSLVAFAAGILNTYGRFKAPAFTPVLLNLSFIAFALLLAPRLEQPVIALAWAVFAGGVAQLAFQIPFLRPHRHAGAAALGAARRGRDPDPEAHGPRGPGGVSVGAGEACSSTRTSPRGCATDRYPGSTTPTA